MRLVEDPGELPRDRVRLPLAPTINEVRFLAGRSLRHIPRIPEKAFGAVLLPLVFVLLFAYVFGSAIQVPGGGNYHAYLVSGIFAQTMIGTRAGDRGRRRVRHPLRPDGPAPDAPDLARLGDRRAHRRGARRALRRPGRGRLCGLIVGWAPHGSVLETVGAFALLLFMGFAVTWAGVWLGLKVRDPDGADGIVMAVIFPAMFLWGFSCRSPACRTGCARSPSSTR